MSKDLKELKERAKNLRAKLGLGKRAKKEERVMAFLKQVVGSFESDSRLFWCRDKYGLRFSVEGLTEEEFDEAVGGLEEMGFVVRHFKKPERHVIVTLLKKPKTVRY